MPLNLAILIVSMILFSSCAPKIYVPGIRHISKGEPAYIDGFLLTEHDLQMLGDIQIDRTNH